jgi:hypothetical protein
MLVRHVGYYNAVTKTSAEAVVVLYLLTHNQKASKIHIIQYEATLCVNSIRLLILCIQNKQPTQSQ